jgi:hypothetical protein
MTIGRCFKVAWAAFIFAAAIVILAIYQEFWWQPFWRKRKKFPCSTNVHIVPMDERGDSSGR